MSSTFTKEQVEAIVRANKASFIKAANEKIQQNEKTYREKLHEVQQALAKMTIERNDLQSQINSLTRDTQVIKNKMVVYENIVADKFEDYLSNLRSTDYVQYYCLENRFVPRSKDCKHCELANETIAELRSRVQRVSEKYKDSYSLINVIESYNIKKDKEIGIKQKYIEKIESRLKDYIEDFESWKGTTVRQLIFFEDLESQKGMLEAEVKDLKEKLDVVEKKLERTMPWKEYKITEQSKSSLINQIQQLNQELNKSEYIGQGMKLISAYKNLGKLNDYQVNNAILLGLNNESTVREALQILSEISVYHDDSQLYESLNIKPKTKDGFEKNPRTLEFTMTGRELMINKYWEYRKKDIPLKELNATDDSIIRNTPDKSIAVDVEAKVDVDTGLPKQGEIQASIQLHTDIKRKIMLMLNETRIDALKSNLPAAMELSKLQSELAVSHQMTALQELTGEEKLKVDVEPVIIKIMNLFKKHNVGLEIETGVLDAIKRMYREMELDYWLKEDNRVKDDDRTDSDYGQFGSPDISHGDYSE